MITFREALPRLEATTTTEPELVEEALDSILAGQWNPTQVGAFIVALRVKGESPSVIAAGASALRRHMVPLIHSGDRALDTCGTGGDGRGSLNISTGAAIIAAACGAAVAKHGNRAVSSKSGSADVLEALGVKIDHSPERAAEIFRRVGLVFLFAPTYHPAMRFVAPVRRDLGLRTLFNCLGPLANPARVTHQLLGAYDDALRPVLAATLRDLGVQRAWVVRGADGMDELSPFGPTMISTVEAGALHELRVTPEDFGLTASSTGAIDGADAEHNARVLGQVLDGAAHPSKDAFLLNAAGALCVYDGLTPPEAMQRARTAVASGQARAKLDEWTRVSREV